ncbi:MAG: FecR domain-containing protein [Proteobacteria bacterium]|nr:FecR domain-containing protein [Pseudomonadota bacterium]
MAKRIVAADFSLIRTLLLGTTVLALVAVPAYAKIGVTSATDGDPLGKPPAETERVLRIGIDVQADELVTTKNNDRAHLVFLDGTSITVGPNAVVKLDKFVYDPDTKRGEMALTASKGVLRLVGGRISKTNAITITTPSSTIGIRGGITILSVSAAKTVSTFVFGNSLTVTGGGATQTITRPGSQVVTNFGGTPGNPTPVPPGGLTGSLGALEGDSNQGGTPGGGNPDQHLQASGFSNINSGQPPTTLPPPTTTTTTTITNTTSNAVSNTNPGTNPNPVTTTATTTTVADTTTTKTIVTYGRLLQEKAYVPATFDPGTLSANRDPNHNQALDPSGSASGTDRTTTVTTTTTTTLAGVQTSQTVTPVSSSTVHGPVFATITAPGGGDSGGTTLTVPWMPGQIFQFQVTTSLGPANGLGLVAANQDYFAYTFVVASGANAGQKFLFFGGTPTAKSEFPKVGIGAQTLTNLGNPGALPFAPDTVGSDAALQANAASSPLYSVYTPNLNGTHGSQSVPGALQVTISIAGSSTTQKSYMGVFIANYGTDSATNTIYSAGTFMDSYRLGANQHIGRGVSHQSTADTGSGNAIYGDTGQYQVYVPDKVVTTKSRHGDSGSWHEGRHHHHRGTTTRTPGAALDQAAANQAPTSYYPVTMATPVADASTLPQDLGQNRTTQTMNGYVGGLVEQRNGDTFKTVVPNILVSKPTDVSISTNAQTNQAMGTIVMRGLDGTLFSLELGGKSGANGPVSAFIDNSRYAMITQTNDPNRQSTVRVGGHTRTVADNTMLASYQTAPVALPGGVQPCTCEYLSWGFWSSNINYSSSRTDNINLGTYVVGQLTDRLQMPQTGSATYAGMMVGNVQHGSNAYVGTGNYNMNWSFQSRAGTFGATFDGTSYAGGAIANPGSGGVTFTGAFGNIASGRAGVLTGSFFGPQAQNQGGSFAIGGAAYKASGIFAGQQVPH